MFNYDAYIRRFLIQHKELSVEKIGSITVNTTIPSPTQAVPQGSFVNFQYDKRAQTTPELISFIAGQTGKNPSLIASNLESYFEQVRQFINIGKPYEIEGLGSIRSNNYGEYEFTQAEAPSFKETRIKNAKPQETGEKARRNALTFFAVVIVILVISALGWGAYKMFFENRFLQNDEDTTAEFATPPPDTITAQIKDTTASTKATEDTTVLKPAEGTLLLKYILETTRSSQRAHTRYEQLKSYGHEIRLDSVQSDTITIYHLFFREELLPADTARVKDSFEKFFQRNFRIVKSK